MTRTTKKPPKRSRAELERKLVELEAQLAHVYHFASQTIHKAANLQASGVLVQLTALGGREITPPFVIKNGLSSATVEALHADLIRSFEDATVFKPKPLPPRSKSTQPSPAEAFQQKGETI